MKQLRSRVLSPPNCSGWQVIFVAIFFAMILRPVAVENNEEVNLLLQGENMHTKKQKNFVSANIKQSAH